MTKPSEPLTPLVEAATQVHEYFCGLISAGFTEAQALYLVGQMLRGSNRTEE